MILNETNVRKPPDRIHDRCIILGAAGPSQCQDHLVFFLSVSFPLLLRPSLSPSLPHWRTSAGNSLGILLLSLSYIHFREKKSRLTFSACISEVITSWLLYLEGSLKGSPYLPTPGLILSHLQNPKSWPTHLLSLLSHCHLLHFLFSEVHL